MSHDCVVDLLRHDGRFPSEVRRIVIQHKTIENTPYLWYRQGNTYVRTTFRPSIDKSQFLINLNFSETSRNEQMNERTIFEMKSKLTNIFLPIILADNQIEVNVEVLQDDGSLFAVIFNSISICLCYYGVTLKDMYFAITLNENADLSSEEENKTYQCQLILSANSKKILFCECTGRIQKRNIQNAIEFGRESICLIYQHVKEYFEKN